MRSGLSTSSALAAALVLASACSSPPPAEPPPAAAPPARAAPAVLPVGPLIPIARTGTFWIAAAYGAHADRYLTLRVDVADPSKSWQLKGRLLDAGNGDFAGPEFHISPDPAAFNAVIGAAVYNAVRREWLVVYQGCPKEGKDDVMGQRIAGDGTKIDAPLPLVVRPGYQNQADAAHDPANDRYLVVWAEKSGKERQIFGRLFDGAGAQAGPEALLSEAPERMKHGPLVAYNPAAGEFLVVWLDYRRWPGQGQDNDYGDVYGQRIDAATGAKIGPNIAVFAPRGAPYKPDGQDAPAGIVCNPKDGRYAVGVTRLMPKGSKLSGWSTFGIILGADGAPACDPFPVSHPAWGFTTGVGHDPVRNRYLMTYEDADQNISGRMISAAGEPLGGAEVALAMPGGIRAGALAVRPADGQFLQAASGDNGTFGAQRFRLRD